VGRISRWRHVRSGHITNPWIRLCGPSRPPWRVVRVSCTSASRLARLSLRHWPSMVRQFMIFAEQPCALPVQNPMSRPTI